VAGQPLILLLACLPQASNESFRDLPAVLFSESMGGATAMLMFTTGGDLDPFANNKMAWTLRVPKKNSSKSISTFLLFYITSIIFYHFSNKKNLLFYTKHSYFFPHINQIY
jgi:hypothetical protein